GDNRSGSGANSSRRSDRLSSAWLNRCELDSSYECRVPQFRHRRIARAEFARLELPVLRQNTSLHNSWFSARITKSVDLVNSSWRRWLRRNPIYSEIRLRQWR